VAVAGVRTRTAASRPAIAIRSRRQLSLDGCAGPPNESVGGVVTDGAPVSARTDCPCVVVACVVVACVVVACVVVACVVVDEEDDELEDDELEDDELEDDEDDELEDDEDDEELEDEVVVVVEQF
jgi:hypothetical protein